MSLLNKSTSFAQYERPSISMPYSKYTFAFAAKQHSLILKMNLPLITISGFQS